MLTIAQEKVLARILGFGAPLVTVFLINGSVTDPVNTPKFFVLGVVGLGALGAVIQARSFLSISDFLIPNILITIFLVLSVCTLLTSEAPLTQSLYGSYGRNNGLLAYIFLSFIFISAMQLQSLKSYQNILLGLITAGIINLIYCGWVLSFGEILAWSNPYGNILGTLGNPNFIGAFLGIFFSVFLAFAVAPGASRLIKISSLFVLPITAFETYQSHAIQGRVLIAGGTGLVGFFWLKSKLTNKWPLWFYSLTGMAAGILALAGALQKGPLTDAVYKTSVSLRGQYWIAGWNTGENHPFTGVGFDSFGDWYRRMRDVRAITLPGINTVVNTAHNVSIDIIAFGGWPLFLVYTAINLYVIVMIIRLARRTTSYDPIFVALAVGWVCYFVQSLISINQIGLAIWGWLLSGLIIGYEHISLKSDTDRMEKIGGASSKKKQSQMNQVFSPGLTAGIAMVVGALLAVPPLSADMKWLSAQKSRSVIQFEQSLVSSYLNPQNSFKYLNSVKAFEDSNLTDLSHKYTLEALKFNPDSYDMWRALYLIKASTGEERDLAVQNMKRLDPLNPDVTAP